MQGRLIQLLLFLVASGVSDCANCAATDTNSTGQPISLPGVENAFRATPKVYSGSQPEGEAAFEAIAKLGIKIVVSVDGAKPDVVLAHQYGLRYIHLPFGYDGIPTNRAVELAKIAQTESGPIYVHCHHGKHRGPAAVAVMCLSSAGWTTNQAVTWMHEAGTADVYPGLYRAAVEFKQPTPAELASATNFPEVAKCGSTVEAMVAIDACFDHLKLSQEGNWQTPENHPDIAPLNEATMLWEQFRELERHPETLPKSADYRAKMKGMESLANQLREHVFMGSNTNLLNAKLKEIGQSCSECHAKYRNHWHSLQTQRFSSENLELVLARRAHSDAAAELDGVSDRHGSMHNSHGKFHQGVQPKTTTPIKIRFDSSSIVVKVVLRRIALEFAI